MRKSLIDSAAAMLAFSTAAFAGPLVTERVNVDPATGVQADGPSYSPVLSANGCVVAFVSQSGTLAPAGYGLTTSSPAQVYAVDRCATPHTLELISVTNDGTGAADRACLAPNISADGRYVAFVTPATNLPVPGSGQNGAGQTVFVRDRVAHATLSPLEAWRPTPQNNGGVGIDGTAALRYMSADATRFAFDFSAQPTIQQNYYVVNFSGGASTLQGMCPAASNACLAGTSDYMTISADGSTVLLQSTYAFAASGVSGIYNVYSYDVASAASALVSATATGTPANASDQPLSDISLSGDGHVAAFSTYLATNFPGSTTDTLQLKNVSTGAVTLVSALDDGTPVKVGFGVALPQLSADGKRVAFTANHSELAPHYNKSLYDAIVADLSLGRLGSVCISASGAYGRLGCDAVTISTDGKWAAFRSLSDNLVPNDTNTVPDIFVVSLDAAVDVIFADGFEP
jgi:Tol biopolymer transport system component